MCWYAYEYRVCQKCKYEFKKGISTLEIAKGNRNKCPQCNYETKVIDKIDKQNNFLEQINKLF